jgi:chorismate synthase
MTPNSFGNAFKITTFGESHSVAMGVLIEGIKPNIEINLKDIQLLLNQRKPKKKLTTKRKEDDEFIVLSGIFNGKTLGSPIVMIIYNRDASPKDYDDLKNVFRPSHADFTFFNKYGIRDYRGGGRASGRETVSRVMGGAVAISFLTDKNIKIVSKIVQIGPFKTNKWDDVDEELPFADKEQLNNIEEFINNLQGDSIGAIIETRIYNLPLGVGEPVFEKLEANIAKSVLSIGATKGIEFGDGFDFANRKGSEVNDQMNQNGFITNHSGGIQGGISNGETIIFRTVIKPTPSISKEQSTVNVENQEVKIKIKGRHDPCIGIRIIPVINSMVAITLLNVGVGPCTYPIFNNVSCTYPIFNNVSCTYPTPNNLDNLRNEISDIDISIFSLLEERFGIVKKISEYKKKYNLQIENQDIENKLIEKINKLKFKNLKKEFIENIYKRIFNESKRIQKDENN